MVSPAPAGEPVYRVYDVTLEPAYQTGALLYERGNCLEAADFAAEVVERRSPDALEIRKGDGDTTETVWTYSESAARAAVESQEKLVNTFGFDVTRWGKPAARAKSCRSERGLRTSQAATLAELEGRGGDPARALDVDGAAPPVGRAAAGALVRG
jgi:hypothetical protein